jgi:hypothetical protein
VGFFDRLFGRKNQGPADEDPEESVEPPSAQRVVSRAMALAIVCFRAEVEQMERAETDDELHLCLVDWVDQLDLPSELEQPELEFIASPLGKADEGASVASSWRVEGLAVLAWALKQFDLPPFDRQLDPAEVRAALGMTTESVLYGNVAASKELMSAAELRPDDEISRFVSDITIVSWRLRQFKLSPAIEANVRAEGVFEPGFTGIREPMDFVAYLRRHPSFKERWLERLPIIDNDLAIRGQSIASAPRSHVTDCTSTVIERQIAAYWLQGDNAVYSKVNPTTFLTGC